MACGFTQTDQPTSARKPGAAKPIIGAEAPTKSHFGELSFLSQPNLPAGMCGVSIDTCRIGV
jgi:hypothetical protein